MEGPKERFRDGCFGLAEEMVGLNVTVRWGLGGTARLPLAIEEIKGVVSVELEAMMDRWANYHQVTIFSPGF